MQLESMSVAAKKKKKTKVEHGPWAAWATMCEAVRDMAEEDVAKALVVELENENRQSFKTRMHARLNRLRAERERSELGIPERRVT